MAYIRKISGLIFLEIRNNQIKCFYGKILYLIEGKYLKDFYGRILYQVDGEYVKDFYGRILYKFENDKEAPISLIFKKSLYFPIFTVCFFKKEILLGF